MPRRTLKILLFACLVFTLLLTSTSFAAGGVTITSLNWVDGGGCEYVAIAGTVIDFSYSDPAVSVQIFKNGSPVASTELSAYPTGNFSQGFVVNAVSGDTITATASISGFNANAGPIVCGGGGGSTGGGSSSGGGGNTTPGDGRLNFAPDEYYTLYCAFDQLEIWRGVPTGLLLHTVPLASLLALSPGQAYAAGGGTTILRDAEDVFTVYGSNGNLAPQAGTKSFLMSECITRNGGEPTAAVEAAPPAVVPQVAFCEDPATFNDRSCFESEEAWCIANNYLPSDCISYNVFRWFGALLTQVFLCAMMAASGAFGIVVMVTPNQLRAKRAEIHAWIERVKRLAR
ncbi:MAG: hypothetical protein IPK17_05585 [Chloroflexi bacterium]|uniref:hypothetical protein n=1 Tax=Candidatus Flexifilum breve TaxID=3140694 RepID=UPI0031372591|nr:hypothetical protein [Chloroflexota bacterium]